MTPQPIFFGFGFSSGHLTEDIGILLDQFYAHELEDREETIDNGIVLDPEEKEEEE